MIQFCSGFSVHSSPSTGLPDVVASPVSSAHSTLSSESICSEFSVPVAGGGGEACASGSGHPCWTPPLQDQTWSWVPFVVLALGSSRHLLPSPLSIVLPEPCRQSWLAEPLHAQSWTLVPLVGTLPAPQLPATDRHMPLTRIDPSGPLTQFCDASFRHCQNWILLPLEVASFASSRHISGVPAELSSAPFSLP